MRKRARYDIFSLMSDPVTTINRTTTAINLHWLGERLPIKVIRATIVTGERDIHSEDVETLKEKYGAKVGDWEYRLCM